MKSRLPTATICLSLFLLGCQSTESLSKDMVSISVKTRRQAALELCWRGDSEDISGALPQLKQALSDDDHFVRLAAIDAISQMGQKAASAVPELRALLKRKDIDPEDTQLESQPLLALTPSRFHACLALAMIGPEGHKAIPDMIVVLESDHSELTSLGARLALQKMGKVAINPLIKQFSNKAGASASVINTLKSMIKEHRDEIRSKLKIVAQSGNPAAKAQASELLKSL